MDTFLQQIVNGLTLGCVYAVVALGYTMVYGIIQLINFAHGEVVMIGCMVAFSVIVALAPSGMPPLAIVGPQRHAIARLISDTVRHWDAETVTHKIEIEVGRDLQFVRINGTLIGGIVGLVLHAVDVLMF